MDKGAEEGGRMTAIDCLKQELERRGATKAQIDSKVAVMVLDIVSGAEGKYMDLSELKKELKIYEDELKHKKRRLDEVSREIEIAEQRLAKFNAEFQKVIDERYRHLFEYIESFYAALNECETAEGRDAMRRAQVFINSVNVETDQNNSMFIQGLALVMAGNPIGNITKIEKVSMPERWKYDRKRIFAKDPL